MRPAARFCALLAAVAVGVEATAQCTTQWSGAGLPGTDAAVRALLPWDPDGAGPLPQVLVAAGDFLVAGAAVGSQVATYDPGSGAWSAVGTGMSAWIHALAAMPNGDLVAGGSFATAGGATAN